MACALVASACISEEPPPATDVQSEPTADTAEVDVPAALKLQILVPAACPDSKIIAVGFSDGCVVKVTCHDPNHGCFPTFCAETLCGGTAPDKAVNICNGNCSSGTNCSRSNMIQLGFGC